MSVLSKLQEARVLLQTSKLKKTGQNKFANYQYFELGDFLPKINEIFYSLKLCGVVRFTVNEATLTITDTEDSSEIVITSPSSEVILKGCLPIQGLGAAQTYLRRYLWVNALEIVEHDALDAITGNDKVKGVVHRPVDNPDFTPDAEELKHLQSILDTIIGLETDFEAIKSFIELQKMDADEKTWVWGKLDSKTRSGIKAVK